MNTLLLTFFVLVSGIVSAQTQFWADDLEGASPTSGTRTPSYSGGSGGPPNTRYFKQTTLANINASAPGYAGIQGTQCWAAEDIDAAPTGVANEQSYEQNIIWTGINISGKIDMSFRGLFATTLTTVWDHQGSPTIGPDYLIVQYRIDGGAWTNCLSFQPNSLNNTNGAMAVDSNGDNLGDGTALNNTFTEFTANIPGSGTTLDVRCNMSANALAEEMAIDNFRVFANASLPVELSAFFSECKAEQEVLAWRSETERDLDYYGVERSDDGLQFLPLAAITAVGTSEIPVDYSYTITDPQKEQQYYRLRMVDLDGSFRFSETISAKDCDESPGLLQSFSVQNDRLECSFTLPQLTYELLTTDGKSVTGKICTNDQLEHTSTVSAGTGVYLLRITNNLQTEQEVYRVFVP